MRYYHDEIGYNSRLDEIQAAIIRIKFKHIDEYNMKRRNNALLYNKYLSAADIKSFVTFRGLIPSPALCFIKTELFIEIMKILKGTWDEYYHEYNIKREGYQRRVAGYLLERLHSHLLCKWLLDGSEPEIPIWGRYVVLNK